MSIAWESMKELIKVIPNFHLRCLNRVQVKFDPFHENAGSIRQFVSILSYPAVRNSNPKCLVKTDVVCDKSEPQIKVVTESGHKILFKAGNLDALELAQEYLKVISRFDIAEPVVEEVAEPKLSKKKSKKK